MCCREYSARLNKGNRKEDEHNKQEGLGPREGAFIYAV